MRHRSMSTALLLAFALAATSAFPQESAAETDRQPPTAEERKARREAMRERWDNMSEDSDSTPRGTPTAP